MASCSKRIFFGLGCQAVVSYFLFCFVSLKLVNPISHHGIWHLLPSKKNSAPRDIPDSPSTPEMERRIYKSQCPVISQAFCFFSLYTSKLQSRSCVRRYLDETPVQVLESVFWQTSDLISKSPTVNLTEVHNAFVSWAPIWKLYQSLVSGVTVSHDFHQLNLSWSSLDHRGKATGGH